jgi:hypothetical protein
LTQHEQQDHTTEDESRYTGTAPVTTMEEIPVLSEQERDELLASLKEAEARAAAKPPTTIPPRSRIA